MKCFIKPSEFNKYRSFLINGYDYDIDFYYLSIKLLFEYSDTEIQTFIQKHMSRRERREDIIEYFKYHFLLKNTRNIQNPFRCILEKQLSVDYSFNKTFSEKKIKYISKWLDELENTKSKKDSFCKIFYFNFTFKIHDFDTEIGDNIGLMHEYYNHWTYCRLVINNPKRAKEKLNFIESIILDDKNKVNKEKNAGGRPKKDYVFVNLFNENFREQHSVKKIERIQTEFKDTESMDKAILFWHLFITRTFISKTKLTTFLRSLTGKYKSRFSYIGDFFKPIKNSIYILDRTKITDDDISEVIKKLNKILK